jgi:hypothetical protein
MLSLKDLAELQSRSSRRAPRHCKTSTEAHTLVCRIGHGHFPSAKAIQELVTAWKQLRKWRQLGAVLAKYLGNKLSLRTRLSEAYADTLARLGISDVCAEGISIPGRRWKHVDLDRISLPLWADHGV